MHGKPPNLAAKIAIAVLVLAILSFLFLINVGPAIFLSS